MDSSPSSIAVPLPQFVVSVVAMFEQLLVDRKGTGPLLAPGADLAGGE